MTQSLPFLVRGLLPFFRGRLAKVEGADRLPLPPFIVAPNHIDFLDAFAIGAALVASDRPAPVVLAETSNYTWTGLTIPIAPHDRGSVLDAAARVLEQAGVVLNFPEGQRNPARRLLPGKTGCVRLALAAHVPIVPVGLTGPRPSRLFGQAVWQYLTMGRFVTVRFGESFRPSSPSVSTPGDIIALTQQLMERIASLSGKQPPEVVRSRQ